MGTKDAGCEIGIVGAGGFAREVFHYLRPSFRSEDAIKFFVDEQYLKDYPMARPIQELDTGRTKIVVAIGDSKARRRIVEALPADSEFHTVIHRSAQIFADDVQIAEGAILCPNVILTTNVQLGAHCHLNLSVTVGHDCVVGDYFTASPGVNVSGNCTIGDQVFIGTNASIREGSTIVSGTAIGLNSAVIHDIMEPGTYVGVPSKKIWPPR